METVEGPRAEAGGAWSAHLGSASPCRFWASVEPYCADITSEEVRTLEELLKPPEDEAEHYKVETLSRDRHDGEQEGSEVPQNQRSRIKDPKATTYHLPSPTLSRLLSAPLSHPDIQSLPLSFSFVLSPFCPIQMVTTS